MFSLCHAGWSKAKLMKALLALLAAGVLLWLLAHFCTGSNTMVTYLLDLASISRSWLAGVSAEQWRTISKGVTIIMIIFLVVAEGIIAWRDGASFPRIAAAVMLVLVKESMWYDVSFG